MKSKNTAFYRNRQAVLYDFTSEAVSSDGALLLLEKIERKHKLLHYYANLLPDYRDPLRTVHSKEKLLKQRVFMLMQGYEDCNDVLHLKHDPVYKDILDGDLASQPTLSRFENGIDRQTLFVLCYAWLDKYISTLGGRKKITIDIDGTDDATHGNQQLSMFNGYYGQFMYNELFFHDGETGQIIVPVLRPGNSHSNRWFVGILRRVIARIRKTYPDIEILIRADSGFSCAPFYKLVEKYDLKYAVGIASNSVLKEKAFRAEKAVRKLYLSNNEKHQHFFSFAYQAGSWEKPERCYCKVESTGIGMNIRYIISNIEPHQARDIYFGFYVKRGDASENRIKEVKNMCFSDRLSNHGFIANFFRLLISSLAYEFFLLIKEGIKKAGNKIASKWQVENIRTYLLKVGVVIKETKRRVYYRFSKAFVFQDLLYELIRQ